jgi:hypothetical protein
VAVTLTVRLHWGWLQVRVMVAFWVDEAGRMAITSITAVSPAFTVMGKVGTVKLVLFEAAVKVRSWLVRL